MRRYIEWTAVNGFGVGLLYAGTHIHPAALVPWKIITVLALVAVMMGSTNRHVQEMAAKRHVYAGTEPKRAISALELVWMVGVSLALLAWMPSGLWMAVVTLNGLFSIIYNNAVCVEYRRYINE